LDSVNISLDTLKADKFEYLTRRKGFHRVLAGLSRAIEIFERVKVNCVVMKGFNDDEIIDFARLARENPIEVRFIEFMPFLGNNWAPDKMLSYLEIMNILKQDIPELIRSQTQPNETSKVFKAPSMLGSVGVISSMSENFCSGCNRLRLTSDGNLKVCLFGRNETSLRDLIRNGATDDELVKAIQLSLNLKKREHSGEQNATLVVIIS